VRAALDRELSWVLASYSLGELRAARRIERGFVDDNWIVDTDLGRYFLKRRHPRRRQTSGLVRAQHELIAWLRQAGFPAPVVLPTATGETYLMLGGELYEVEAYIAGEPYDHDRPEHLAVAALTLGQYHALVEGFAPRALCERDALYGPASSRAALARLGETWHLGDTPEFRGLVQRLEACLEGLAARFAGHGELHRLVIHGDYYAGNLIFDGDRIVGVVDYDKANWQPRVAEVAEALIYFASPRPGYLRHLVYSGFLDWEPFAFFLQNYARAASLGEEEIEALPDYVGCIWISMSVQRLTEKHPCRPAEAMEALQEVLALCEWASVSAPAMVEIAHAAMPG
jgi:Ser/Thr protein kinase RdoA (MazF antagonist)